MVPCQDLLLQIYVVLWNYNFAATGRRVKAPSLVYLLTTRVYMHAHTFISYMYVRVYLYI